MANEIKTCKECIHYTESTTRPGKIIGYCYSWDDETRPNNIICAFFKEPTKQNTSTNGG